MIVRAVGLPTAMAAAFGARLDPEQADIECY